MIDILRRTRPLNLVILMAIMFGTKYGIFKTLLATQGLELQVDFLPFLGICIATLFIAGGGYLINDYYDQGIDLINKEKTVENKSRLLKTYWLLAVAGNLLAVLVLFNIEAKYLIAIFPICTGLLWYYATNYKLSLLIGNIIVSILCAFIPVLVLLVEFPSLIVAYRDALIEQNENLNYIIASSLIFALFSFLYTFVREVVKDMEDMEGDMAYGSNSIPVVFGIVFSKWLVTIVAGLNVLLLAYFHMQYFKHPFMLLYSGIFIGIPTIFFIYRIIKADLKKDYTFASRLLKLIMLSGVLYTVVLSYYFNEYQPGL